MRAPNKRDYTDAITVTPTIGNTQAAHGGPIPTPGSPVDYPNCIVTQHDSSDQSRLVTQGTTLDVTLWDVLIWNPTDPGIVLEQQILFGTHKLQALGPTCPRGVGVFYVLCQEET